jgi:PRTRC genetic system protein C
MPIERKELKRVFIYAGARLADPDASMSAIDVRDLYAASGRPDLSSAEVQGPTLVGDEQHYTFHKAIGSKALYRCDKDLRKAVLPPALAKAVQDVEGGNDLMKSMEAIPMAEVAVKNRGVKFSMPPSSLIPWTF